MTSHPCDPTCICPCTVLEAKFWLCPCSGKLMWKWLSLHPPGGSASVQHQHQQQMNESVDGSSTRTGDVDQQVVLRRQPAAPVSKSNGRVSQQPCRRSRLQAESATLDSNDLYNVNNLPPWTDDRISSSNGLPRSTDNLRQSSSRLNGGHSTHLEKETTC